MIIHYEPAPLPGRCYACRVRWVPELDDFIMITLFDPERIQPFLDNAHTAAAPGQMCESVQNIPTVPPGRHLYSVA